MAEALRFDLLANDRASAVFDKVGKAAGDTESRFSKVSSRLATFGKVAAAGLAAGGAAAVIGGRHFLDLATKTEQMGMKAKTVFGGQLGMVDKWADKNASAMGLTGSQATGLAANFADLLIPMGFARKDAAKMSTSVVGLSGALSQWSGGTVSAAEASDVLAKAMLGERDGLKALGISISEADVKARLLKNGQDGLTGAAAQQAAAMATQQLIMEKSTDAQAAYAAGGSPLLSSQAKIKAAFGELQEKLATGLIPVFSSVLSGVSSIATAFQSGGLGAAIGYVGQQIGAALPVIQAKLMEWGRAFVEWIGPQIPPMLAKLGELATSLAGWVTGTALPWLGQALVRWGKAFVEWIGPMIPPALSALGAGAGRLFDWLLSTGLPRLLSNLRKWGTALVEWIAPMIPPALAAMALLGGRLVAWVVTDGIPKLAGALVRLGLELIQWIPPMIPRAVAALAGLGARLVGWVVSEGIPTLAAKMAAMGLRALESLKDGAVNGFQTMLGWLGGLGPRILSGIGSLGSLLVGVGQDLVRGMINGIKSLAGEVAATARRMAADAVAAIKDAIKIGSPSKVTYQLGEFFAQGMANGIKNRAKVVAEATKALADKALEKLGDLKSQAKQITEGVASAMTGALDVGSLGRINEDGSRESVTNQLGDFAAQAGQFAKALTSAAAKGLNAGLVAKVAQLGPSQGLTAAQALAAMDAAQVASANASLAAVDEYAAQLGQTVLTTTSLPEEIAKQQGILDTLKEIKADLSAGRTINFTINDATDPDAVVRAIRKYVKRNGKLRDVADN